jgi:hypothetical protein
MKTFDDCLREILMKKELDMRWFTHTNLVSASRIFENQFKKPIVITSDDSDMTNNDDLGDSIKHSKSEHFGHRHVGCGKPGGSKRH